MSTELNFDTAIRGAVLTYKDDPFVVGLDKAMVYESDALILIKDGKITEFAPADQLLPKLPAGTEVVRYDENHLIMPGFIDTHVHMPQTQMIAAYGEQLLEWLNNYTFPTELGFADKEHAREISKVFLRETIKAGTTSSTVYGTVFPQSVDAFFEESEKLGTRMMCGKVMMDRFAPEGLLDTAQKGYDDSKALLNKWHNNGRQMYVVTPRFAPTSTPAQLEAAGALYQENKAQGVFLQSHVSENKGEIEWVKELYPERKGYVDVYDHYKCLGERTIYGHGIHLTDDEFRVLSETGTAISHCPTSNLFLGSGCFDMEKAQLSDTRIRVGLATDLGAGTSFSQLQTLNESYKVCQLNGFSLSAGHAFYLATRGSAQSLYLEDTIGSIAPGMEADLCVLDLKSTPIIDYRMKYAKDLEEILFIQMIMGDDRANRATWVNGKLAYDRDTGYYLGDA